MAKTPRTKSDTPKEASAEKRVQRAPSAKATERATERARLERALGVEPGTCLSGSGVTPRKGLFGPGGDAKLKSRLLNDYRTGNAQAKARAIKQAEALGWSKHLTDAPVKTPRAPKVAHTPEPVDAPA